MSTPTLADATPRESDTSGDSAANRRRVQALLSSAKRGDRQSIGELLSQYRTYLTLLGAAQFRQRLRPRVSPSDIVQDVMLRAHCHFGQFRGHTEPELLAWLREILLNSLARFVEQHLHAAKRDIRREISIDQFADSAAGLGQRAIPVDDPGTRIAEAGDQAALLANLLEQLPAHYREVLQLRNIQGLSFEEVAARLGRSAGATRMLWLRAIEKLRAVSKTERGAPESE
jgi:RNA polymerase sigma-70 factor (ECF subfamily)